MKKIFLVLICFSAVVIGSSQTSVEDKISEEPTEYCYGEGGNNYCYQYGAGSRCWAERWGQEISCCTGSRQGG